MLGEQLKPNKNLKEIFKTSKKLVNNCTHSAQEVHYKPNQTRQYVKAKSH